MSETTNTYSQTWFKLFLETQAFTEQETAFVIRQLPNPPYRRVLDLCCGQGRHTRPLAKAGYEMVGVDLDEAALARARRDTGESATYVRLDMRRLEELPGTFDAVISLWQSFGYFDAATNRDVLRQISQKLNPKGRLILDIYHRDFWEAHQGSRQIERRGVTVTATNTMRGKRLTARLDYGDGSCGDTFEWQLFTPDEIRQVAAKFDLRCLLACTECDEEQPATAEKARMHLVFERNG